jgi:hypothetical protein
MIGLPEAATAAVRDPLVVTLAVLLLGGLLTHLLFRRHPLSRATLRVIFLVALTIVLLHAGVVPYEPQARTGVPCCATNGMRKRIASPEMLPDAEMLPHLICSRPILIGGANDEADQHGDA